MATIDVRRRSTRSRQQLWNVLADFPNIASWNSGVKRSRATSEQGRGVGASRHCELSPAGELEETVVEWDEPGLMVVRIDEAKKLPIAHGYARFTLDEVGDGTDLSLHYEYEPAWGVIGRLITPLLNRQLRRGFAGFLDDWDAAAA